MTHGAHLSGANVSALPGDRVLGVNVWGAHVSALT